MIGLNVGRIRPIFMTKAQKGEIHFFSQSCFSKISHLVGFFIEYEVVLRLGDARLYLRACSEDVILAGLRSFIYNCKKNMKKLRGRQQICRRLPHNSRVNRNEIKNKTTISTNGSLDAACLSPYKVIDDQILCGTTDMKRKISTDTAHASTRICTLKNT